MSILKRIAIIPAAVAVCGIAAGCFSYHKNVDQTTPAPVVETAPAPAPVVVAPPATSSTTTTTTDNGLVERQKTTTYTAP
jgi:hypothetical protein